MKRFGRSQHGRQRWYCLQCQRTYSWRLHSARASRRFYWFKLWVVEGYSVRELARLSRFSTTTIRRVILYWLERPPTMDFPCSFIKHIIVDGTFLQRNRGIYAAMNTEGHQLISAGYNVREGAKDLLTFYTHLALRGLVPNSATIDGNPQQTKYLRTIWPSVELQRCIVHVQRQGLSWCRRTPKRADARQLRTLFLALTNVHTETARRQFIRRVQAWEQRFGPRIDSSPNRGWVFSDLMRARSMLLKALPDLFHYLDNKKIARSTNALEGYFSRLKERYRRHRGLSIKHRDAYFRWYFYLVSR